MDQIFNELSVSRCYADEYAARSGMENVIAISRGLHTKGFSRNIRTREDFYARELTTDYSIGKWAIDRCVDPDLRRYFLTHATKTPYIDELLMQENDHTTAGLQEFLCEGEEALGLGLAYLWDGPSLSLSEDVRFVTDPVLITHRFLVENSTLLQEKRVEVCNLCCPEQLEARAAWFQKRLRQMVSTGMALIENTASLFPHLLFCQNATDQIIKLTGNEQYFHEVVRHLFELETAILNYVRGPLHIENVTYSTESESTMNNQTFKKKREFICQDRNVRVFKLHTKIMSANKRIYFFPSYADRVIHIGYIGDHLPTALYST